MKLDKETDKIGLVIKGANFNERQLNRELALEVEVGADRSFIRILGPVTNKGRGRVRNYHVKNSEVAREARRICEKNKILRLNVEIKNP